MPASFVVNPNTSKTLERTVRSIYVAAGKAIINVGDEVEIVEEHNEFDAGGAANATISAPNSGGAVINVVYADDPEASPQVARKPARAGDASTPPTKPREQKKAKSKK